MKMYDYEYAMVSYDWIIWLLNDISNPYKELIKGKQLYKYDKAILERILVKFKEVR